MQQPNLDETLIAPPGALELFYAKHKVAILASLGTLAILAVIGGIRYVAVESNRAAAAAALAAASSPEAWRDVIGRYPKSLATGHAYLLLAEAERSAGRLDEANKLLETFVARLPNHPFVSLGHLALAENLALAGKTGEATKRLEELGNSPDKSFVAPIALFSAGELYLAELQREKARRVFTLLQTLYPNSVSTEAVRSEVNALNAIVGEPAEAPPRK